MMRWYPLHTETGTIHLGWNKGLVCKEYSLEDEKIAFALSGVKTHEVIVLDMAQKVFTEREDFELFMNSYIEKSAHSVELLKPFTDLISFVLIRKMINWEAEKKIEIPI